MLHLVRSPTVFNVLAIIAFLVYLFKSFPTYHQISSWSDSHLSSYLTSAPGFFKKLSWSTSEPARIGRVYMHYGDAGDMTEVFNKTMTNHLAYDKLHGYPSFVLASDIYNGLFNKPLFLSQIMAEELEKSEDERLEWLFWTDVDTVIMNPLIPLETFLPPEGGNLDDIQIIMSKDWNAINMGVFYVRVSKWSLEFMSEISVYRQFNPDKNYNWLEQSAMIHLLEEHEEYERTNMAYVPQHWFNGYHTGAREHRDDGFVDASGFDQLEGSDFREGGLLIHFAGDKKWMMKTYLDIAATHNASWEIPVEKSDYPWEASAFWRRERGERTKRMREWEEAQAEEERQREKEEEHERWRQEEKQKEEEERQREEEGKQEEEREREEREQEASNQSEDGNKDE